METKTKVFIAVVVILLLATSIGVYNSKSKEVEKPPKVGVGGTLEEYRTELENTVLG